MEYLNLNSFETKRSVTINSLKTHFLPIQEGEGDPSPENVRPITGWNSIKIRKCGKNLAKIVGYSATNVDSATSTRKLTNKYGTTISSTNNVDKLIITQTDHPDSNVKSSYNNGYFAVLLDGLTFNKKYNVSFRVTDIISNPFDIPLETNIVIYTPLGGSTTAYISEDGVCFFKNFNFTRNTGVPNRCSIEIRNCGMSFTLSEFMVTAVENKDFTYEPYREEEYIYEPSGKNMLDTSTMEIGKWTSDSGVVDNVSRGAISKPFSVLSNQSYTYSFHGIIPYSFSVIELDTNKTFIKRTHVGIGDNGVGPNYCSIITTNDTSFVYCQVYVKRTDADAITMDLVNSYQLQFEEGSEKTSYELYPHIFYGGYLDIAKGEVVQEWECVELDTLNWYRWCADTTKYPGSTPIFCTYDCVDDISSVAKNYRNGIVWLISGLKHSYEKIGANRVNMSYTVTENNAFAIAQSGGTGHMSIRADDYDNVEDFLVFLKGKTCAYPKQNPIHYSLPPETLKTLRGFNTIFSTGNDIIEVGYSEMSPTSLLKRRRDIIASEPHLVTVETGNTEDSDIIASFKTNTTLPIKSMVTNFEPKQDLNGYPSPFPEGGGSNILEVSSEKRVAYNANYTNWTESDNVITISGNIMGGYLVSCEPNTTYTYSFKYDTQYLTRFHARVWEGTEDPITSITSSDMLTVNVTLSSAPNAVFTFTTKSDTVCLVVGFYVYQVESPITVTEMQLEKGSTATKYNAYGSSNICPIEGITELKIRRCGRNFLDHNLTNPVNPIGFPNASIVVNEDRSLTVSSAAASSTQVLLRNFHDQTRITSRQNDMIKHIPNGVFKYRIGNAVDPLRLQFYYAVNDSVSNFNNTVVPPGIVPIGIARGNVFVESEVTEEMKYNFFSLASYAGDAYSNITIYPEIYLKSQSDGAYEPYVGDDYIIQLPENDCDLCSETGILIYNKTLELVDGVYKNLVTDTRETLDIYVQTWSTGGSFSQNIVMMQSVDIGHLSITFSIDDPTANYIALTHNGKTRNIPLLLAIPYAKGEYTVSFDILSNDPTTIGGYQFTNVKLQYNDDPYSKKFYGGYIDIVNGEYVKTWRTITLLPSIKLSYGSTYGYKFCFPFSNSIYKQQQTHGPKAYGLTNSYVVSGTGGLAIGKSFIENTLGIEYTEAAFQQYLQDQLDNGTPLQLTYSLKNPVHYQLDPVTVKTLKGTNNIYTNANGKSIIKYWTH